ncbi:3-deoxy-manno-octulosonate cytidylyltransferase [Bremerella volcania]|uniref:3-deoxy-manno-octulosonate cytidylyltransferase n=1 Tax=Bremerella volcania TaxID=2527984 RepID=A0A518C350_9BACT|nr:NTP transferase domain-containing protein [Bremerella volcania]QDU73649.1 3-deoxy-manno-octulosonate cytidylyltransferase [Bremerella volcania]
MNDSPPSQVGAVVLARTDSTRFPRKVFTDFMGQPMLGYLLERLTHCFPKQQIVVATSDRTIDDDITRFCEEYQVPCFRGDLNNVCHRAISAAKSQGWQWFARVNGDSPLFDESLTRRAIDVCLTKQLDLVTNLVPRSFPYGISSEIVRTSTLERMMPLAEECELEHVTKVLYEHLDSIHWENISLDEDVSSIRMTVDTPDDLRQLTERITRCGVGSSAVTFRDLIPT